MICAHSGAGRWILLAVCGPGCVWTCLSVALAACGPGGGSRAWPACVVCGGVGCGVRRSIPLLYAPLPPVPVIGMPKKPSKLAVMFARQKAAETVRVSLCHCHAYRFLTNQMVGRHRTPAARRPRHCLSGKRLQKRYVFHFVIVMCIEV